MIVLNIRVCSSLLSITCEQLARTMTSPDDTLIVVTADHSHVFSYSGYAHRRTSILDLNRDKSLDGKPYTNILYANGPGYYSNLRNFTKDNITYYEARANLADPKEKFNISNYGYQYFAALPLKWEAHGGEDVPIYAHGPGSHQFIGVHEQNAIPHLIYCSACFGPYHPDCPCDGTPSTDTSGAWRAATIALSIVSGIALLAVAGFLLVYFLKLRPMLNEASGPSNVRWSSNDKD
jgi:alkaline phosphatase